MRDLTRTRLPSLPLFTPRFGRVTALATDYVPSPSRDRSGCSRDIVSLERAEERGRLGHPAEQSLDHERGGVVVTAREVISDRLAGAIAQKQAAIVAIERVTEGRVDADACRAAGEDE